MSTKFVPRRTQRYEALRKVGFTKAESRTLSHIPEDVPYLIEMKKARSEDYTKFKQSHQRISARELDKLWENRIGALYRDRKWGNGKRASDVWEMLRSNSHGEDAYKQKDKQYKSPWIDKQKQFRNTTSAVDKGLAS